MIVGKLNQRVTIQSATTINGKGSQTRTYTTYATRWAQVKPFIGSEGNDGSGKAASRPIEVIVRAAQLTLDETMRIVWKGKTYNITSIDADTKTQAPAYYVLRCEGKDNS